MVEMTDYMLVVKMVVVLVVVKVELLDTEMVVP